jgi:hypothetical protein
MSPNYESFTDGIRNWAKQGVILLTPAVKWVNGRFAQAYHRIIKKPDNKHS